MIVAIYIDLSTFGLFCDVSSVYDIWTAGSMPLVVYVLMGISPMLDGVYVEAGGHLGHYRWCM